MELNQHRLYEDMHMCELCVRLCAFVCIFMQIHRNRGGLHYGCQWVAVFDDRHADTRHSFICEWIICEVATNQVSFLRLERFVFLQLLDFPLWRKSKEHSLLLTTSLLKNMFETLKNRRNKPCAGSSIKEVPSRCWETEEPSSPYLRRASWPGR